MWVLFAALSAALLLTCIWQRIQYRKLQKEKTMQSGMAVMESILPCVLQQKKAKASLK